MGIDWMIKMKIGSKLFWSYLLVLLLGFTVSGVSFHYLSQRYLLAQARQEIKAEAQIVATILSKVTLNDSDSLGNLLLERRQLKVAGRWLDAKIMVFNPEDKVVYSNLSPSERKVILLARADHSFGRDYVGDNIPILSESGAVKGQLLIFSKVTDIVAIDLLARRTQVFSFFIAGILALLLAWWFEKGLTKPIRGLMQSMNSFSAQGPLPELDLTQADEIGELARCFRDLAVKLRAYDERQQALLQNASHELKTPLMSIQGYAEAIKDGVVQGEEVGRSLDIIIDESQRLKRVVEDIIYLNRLESMEEKFDFAPTCLEEIINQAVQTLKPLADERKVHIDVAAGLNLTGDFNREKLVRAFINVLGNGIRYAHHQVSIHGGMRDGAAEIFIQDDGPGFTRGEIDQIFDRFYSGETGGTGLGLAICRSIVTGHGGTITAVNIEGEGAVFKILLPLHHATN